MKLLLGLLFVIGTIVWLFWPLIKSYFRDPTAATARFGSREDIQNLLNAANNYSTSYAELDRRLEEFRLKYKFSEDDRDFNEIMAAVFRHYFTCYPDRRPGLT